MHDVGYGDLWVAAVLAVISAGYVVFKIAEAWRISREFEARAHGKGAERVTRPEGLSQPRTDAPAERP